MIYRVVRGQKALLAYPCMITQIFLEARVLQILGIDDMIEARRTFDIRRIRDAKNPLAGPVRQEVDIIEGLFP